MLKGFEKKINAALRASDEDDNKVADVVMDLRRAGYDPCELAETLRFFGKKLIADEECLIVREALEEIEGWCRHDDE